MRIRLDKLDSTVVKSNETYDVIDNTNLNKLITSKTILHSGKKTGGHFHKGQEEVYIFTQGWGRMVVGENKFEVQEDDVVLIPDGEYHQVWNNSQTKDLVFICVFDGSRNH